MVTFLSFTQKKRIFVTKNALFLLYSGATASITTCLRRRSCRNSHSDSRPYRR